MKKFVMALSLALATSIALAQTPGSPTGGGKSAPAAHMKDELGLTDEQVRKMREIREAGGSREEMNAVLTPEQQAKAAEMRKAHTGKRMDHMQEFLGLSDEQAAKIEQLRKSGGSREEIRAVLTPEQQAKLDAKKQDRKKEMLDAEGAGPAGHPPMPE